MENRLDDQAPDPGMLWLAIGIGAFSVFASFVLAIYCSKPTQEDTAPQAIEASAEGSVS